MLQITIEGKQYGIKTEWSELTLKDYTHYIKNIVPTMPPQLKAFLTETDTEAKNTIIQGLDLTSLIPYFVDVIAFFSDIPKDELLQYEATIENLRTFERLYFGILKAFSSEPKDERRKEITHKGETFYLPERGMQGSKVGELIECYEFERRIADVNGNELEALPLIACALCKRKGERFMGEVDETKAAFFADMAMSEAWQLFFFIKKLNSLYKAALPFVLARNERESKLLRDMTI
jgi:hypothetical protein